MMIIHKLKTKYTIVQSFQLQHFFFPFWPISAETFKPWLLILGAFYLFDLFNFQEPFRALVSFIKALYQKTALNAVRNTLFNYQSWKFLELHSMAPWKLYVLASCISSSCETNLFRLILDEPADFISSFTFSSASVLRSDLVPTRMQGAACAQFFTS